MLVFQLDECINSKKLAQDCEKEGKARVRRFPSNLRGAKDPVVVRHLLLADGATGPLVTFDRTLADEQSQSLNRHHGGLVVVEKAIDTHRTMTSNTARQIIEKFKEKFPMWHEVPWGNSIVRITETHVSVSRVVDGVPVQDLFRTFDSPDWAREVEQALKNNVESAAS